MNYNLLEFAITGLPGDLQCDIDHDIRKRKNYEGLKKHIGMLSRFAFLLNDTDTVLDAIESFENIEMIISVLSVYLMEKDLFEKKKG